MRGSPTLIQPWQPVILRWNGIGAAEQVRYSTLDMSYIKIAENVGLTSLNLIDPCSHLTSKLVRFISLTEGSWASPRRLMLASTPPHFESNFIFFLSSSDSPASKGGSKERGTDREGSWNNMLHTTIKTTKCY